MNTSHCLRITGYNLYSPMIEYINHETIKNNINESISTAFSSLKSNLNRAYTQIIGRVTENRNSSSASIPLPMAIHNPESQLAEICHIAISKTQDENEEVLIKKARDLIKEGIGISPEFKKWSVGLAWLREHCAEELRERVMVSKERPRKN